MSPKNFGRTFDDESDELVCLGSGMFAGVTAVSSVILRIQESPLLAVAYAGGFAAGNGIGIVLERRLAFGQCALRMVTRRGTELESLGHEFGRVVAKMK